jgi:hypothetical protein
MHPYPFGVKASIVNHNAVRRVANSCCASKTMPGNHMLDFDIEATERVIARAH